MVWGGTTMFVFRLCVASRWSVTVTLSPTASRNGPARNCKELASVWVTVALVVTAFAPVVVIWYVTCVLRASMLPTESSIWSGIW